MKLFGLMVAQNESDIIEDVLQFLANLNIYEAIFFYDLGSTDDTFTRAQRFRDLLYQPQVLNEPYTEKLRYDLLAQHRSLYTEGDWLAIVDVDEFYVDNPVELIRFAENEHATCIRTYQAHFMFTDADLENFEKEDQSLPICERRKYYLINWSEPRFFKYLPDHGLFDLSRPSSKRMLNRHYQYRTPAQIDTRIKVRMENKRKTSRMRGRQEWSQIFSQNWRDYIVPHAVLHTDKGGDLQFGLPDGVHWKDYYSKDPFCGVLPQVATFFTAERQLSPAGNHTGKRGEHYTSGRITFHDRFAGIVFDEALISLARGKISDAAQGFRVVFLYQVRMFSNSIEPRWIVFGSKIKNFIWNLLKTLERILRGKSIGIIRATPNPVEVSDVSGAGTVILKWKSLRLKKAELRIDSPDGQIIHSADSSGSFTPGNWIANDMVFYLQDGSAESGSTASNTLSKVMVKVTNGNKITI